MKEKRNIAHIGLLEISIFGADIFVLCTLKNKYTNKETIKNLNCEK